jgi:hypothetical protein
MNSGSRIDHDESSEIDQNSTASILVRKFAPEKLALTSEELKCLLLSDELDKIHQQEHVDDESPEAEPEK